MARGGGAYFSFTSRTNNYDQGPDLGLEQKTFSSGFYGGCFGFVAKLEAGDLLTLTTADVPELLRKPAEELSQARRGRAGRPGRAGTPGGVIRGGQGGAGGGIETLPRRSPAVVGALYAVRSVREGKADTLAAFTVIRIDEDGATIAWRILERYPVWSRPR